MKIEVLYSEVAGMYGDLANIKYLEQCMKAKVYYTGLNDVPRFTKEKIDFIYMGPMIEKYQGIIINKLKPYKKKIKELIESNVFFLITGNAIEIFGKSIDDINALGIFNFYSKRNFNKHHISCFVGEFKDLKIVGFQSKFSYSYNNEYPFINIIHGYGFNDDIKEEGIHYKNFYGTYLIGPILILNPDFTKYILDKLNVKYSLAFESDIRIAYENRLSEFLDPRMHFKDRTSC